MDQLIDRLRAGKRVRRTIDGVGELYLDRLLPFVTVYRAPASGADPAMRQIVTSQPTYLIGPRARVADAPIHTFLHTLTAEMADEFGTVLVLELWSDERLRAEESAETPLRYHVRIHMPEEFQNQPMSRHFYHDLSRIRLAGAPIGVTYARRGQRIGPKGAPNLIAADDPPIARRTVSVGLALSPSFRDQADDALRPVLLKRLRQQLALAIQRLHYNFSVTHTTLTPPHHFSLGKRAFSQPAREIDRQLVQIGRSFDLIMTATPVNVDDAWREFRESHFDKAPRFLYRPLVVDPDTLKRRLWGISLSRVDDPSMEELFTTKRDELDVQISMLLERNTPRFLFDGLRLYGAVPRSLLELARGILSQTRRGPRRDTRGVGKRQLTATAFAALAEEELSSYRRTLRENECAVDEEVIDDLAVEVRSGISGVLTVRGKLLVSRSFRVQERRATALIQHEIGTHVLTYINGMSQPIQLLGAGLNGYEALQEGLAVTAEYLSGGLDATRLALLAARVVAAHSVEEGADFVETYRTLQGLTRLSPRTAYLVTMRVHRAGGFVKDFIYLKGLVEILDYLAGGGELDLLWTGKVSLSHVRLLKELRFRKILRQPCLVPSYNRGDAYRDRLDALIKGVRVTDLLDTSNTGESTK